MRGLSRHLAAAALVLAAVVPVGAQAAESPAGAALSRAQVGTYPGESYTQYRYYGGRYYGRGYRGGRGVGAGVAAGVIGGLALGALAAGAVAGPAAGPTGPGTPVGNIYGRDPNWVSYCASRYPGFDPVSGTFQGPDGFRYPCR